MANVLDVASRILASTGEVSTIKLQKLVFYSQAYHLVKYGSPLFDDRIEAWKNGPVTPALFSCHRGRYVIGAQDLPKSTPIGGTEASAIDKTVSILGGFTGAELSTLTHSEAPWRDARGDLANGARSNEIISIDSIRDYYESPDCTNPLFA